MTIEEVTDKWIRCSSSGTFYLLVSPDILPHDAKFVEEVTALSMKVLHQCAAQNQAKKLAASEETRKACAEFWAELRNR